MALEIERKFLVIGNYKQYAYADEEIVQGYLSSIAERTVRIRIKGDKAYITIKGISNESGLSRYEWEKEIPVNEAHELIKLCEPGIIDKVRYYVRNGERTFEVDEFRGDNDGLVIAEIELDSESEVFDRPTWLGDEVTGDIRYYNASLVKNPYKNWR
ncbi:CYTH domain-containing protein [Dysgonomonas sp. Marseille-P4677]|uniref:CYTH domain-containing protein n=1 Tax=Dysgonomonas sp. Marseille-P4677 TaxID=2364790 RepID=UPI001913AF9E|nr:CYTH domain-containing protein [Dysgonomonas sp. Marseille-P4677]MBK5719708.1 CYTH domain-containing protein [Dysgonomonas sp. Marseille-P4677]